MDADASLARGRWNALCQRLLLQGGDCMFDELHSRYNEPHRVYHNTRHIVDCLQQFDQSPQVTSANDIIELAIWFHDAVYDIRAADNVPPRQLPPQLLAVSEDCRK